MISWRLISLLVRSNVNDYQFGTLLHGFAPVSHACNAECASGVVDRDERIPLAHDKRARRIYTKPHLLTGCVESVTVAESNHA
jgi:hypothetical protein